MDQTRVEQDRLKALLVDTVTLLCKNGLKFMTKLHVQGLLAVTIDEGDVFVVQLSDVLHSDLATVDSNQPHMKTIEETSNRQDQASGNLRRAADSGLDVSTSSRKSVSHKSSSQKIHQNSSKSSEIIKIEDLTEDNYNEQEQDLSHLSQTDHASLLSNIEHAADVKPVLNDDFSQCSSGFTSPKRRKTKSAHVKQENIPLSDAGLEAAVSAVYGEGGVEEGGQDEMNHMNDVMGDEGEDDTMMWNEEYDQDDEYSILDPNYDDGGTDDSRSGTKNKMNNENCASICEYENCGKWFNHRRSLYRHQRLKHGALYGSSGQMCFYCTVPSCHRVFYVRRTLEKHQRDVHNMNVWPA